MNNIHKIGFGGGCHWCTEAVFQSLRGVKKVDQGWIASTGENSAFSEAVIVDFNPKMIPLEVLIKVHLHTHKSTSEHSMRKAYRSAIYVFNPEETEEIEKILSQLKSSFKEKLITQVLPFSEYKASREDIVNYYYKNPKKPFCERYINPKLNLLLEKFSMYVNYERLKKD